jgi:hypothetical protein
MQHPALSRLAIVLALACASLLAACGGGSSPAPAAESPQPTTTPVQPPVVPPQSGSAAEDPGDEEPAPPVVDGPKVALSVSVSSGGAVSSLSAGIACGSDCSEEFAAGSSVTLVATPAEYRRFDGWTGACAGSTHTCVLTLSEARSVGASFSPLSAAAPDPAHTLLRIFLEGLGTVSSTPAGVSCGDVCSQYFPPTTTVTLVATPAAGFRFGHWSGDCTGSGPCTVSMSAARTTSAVFVPEPSTVTHALAIAVSGSGSGGYVGSSPAGILCGGGGTDCSESYSHGTQVALIPRPAAGFIFDGWEGACSGLNPCFLGMTDARSATARFVAAPSQPQQALTASTTGPGVVRSVPTGIDCGADCSETYATGTTVTLTALASPGSVFEGWSGACAGLNPTCIVPLQAARSVAARFGSPADPRSPGAVDALIAAMPPNSWRELPNTEMREVCPLPYEHPYLCETVITAWSGGAYDASRERMFVYGGGHADSYYNNVFVFDLVSMQWRRLSEMSPGATGETPGPGWADIRLESCGFYPRGPVNLPSSVMRGAYVDEAQCFVEPVLSQLDLQQPRSAHTYGENYVDAAGRYCFLGAGAYYVSAQTGTHVSVCFDPATQRWSRVADRPRLVGGAGNALVDSRGFVWSLAASGGYVARYDRSTDSWRTYGYVNSEATGSADVDRRRNHAYVLYTKLAPDATFRGYAMRRFDLTSAAALNARPAYAELPTTGEAPVNIGLRPGFAYAEDRDKFFAWGGGRDVYTFDPGTRRWRRFTGTGDSPGAQAHNGNFGRFRYSAARGVFVLVNSSRQNVFIYKPAD